MDYLIKLECTLCGGRFYVFPGDLSYVLQLGLKDGEAFPFDCPLCEDGRFAVLAEEEEDGKK